MMNNTTNISTTAFLCASISIDVILEYARYILLALSLLLTLIGIIGTIINHIKNKKITLDDLDKILNKVDKTKEIVENEQTRRNEENRNRHRQ